MGGPMLRVLLAPIGLICALAAYPAEAACPEHGDWTATPAADRAAYEAFAAEPGAKRLYNGLTYRFLFRGPEDAPAYGYDTAQRVMVHSRDKVIIAPDWANDSFARNAPVRAPAYDDFSCAVPRAMTLMREGDRMVFAAPPWLSEQDGLRPSARGRVLLFEVEMLSIRPANEP